MFPTWDTWSEERKQNMIVDAQKNTHQMSLIELRAALKDTQKMVNLVMLKQKQPLYDP